ncbi:hypothetical protein [Nonomuraea sp. NPDC050691]|uniref:hypothetical protein n=1 Tax=Nonomuraea sp. NPDC050691 TaxID=3155661 RepID=UPI0033E868E9
MEAQTGGVRVPVALSRRHLSRALLSDGADAESHYRGALAGCELDQRLFDRARIQLLYSEWLHRDRGAEAPPMLRAARETFETLGAETWARRALGPFRAAGGTLDRAGRSPPCSARRNRRCPGSPRKG